MALDPSNSGNLEQLVLKGLITGCSKKWTVSNCNCYTERNGLVLRVQENFPTRSETVKTSGLCDFVHFAATCVRGTTRTVCRLASS